MTDQSLQFPRFYVTAPSECPYIEGREERKVFTELKGPDAAPLNEALGRVGFRRSQNIAYRPACEGCAACISVRIPVRMFAPSRGMRRILNRNRDLTGTPVETVVTEEQYALLNRYLSHRHAGGSMCDMSIEDYREMVEQTPVDTLLIEYRHRLTGELKGVALTDRLSEGYSMIYSFFDAEDAKRSLGSYLILDHVERVLQGGYPFLYLGYWIKGSPKMSYKQRFQPLEKLGPEGWTLMDDSDI